MKKLFSIVLFLSIMVSACAQKPSKDEGPSLFDRLGGTEGISMIIDDMVDIHMKNPAINARFLPDKGTEKLEVTKQHVKDFLSAGSGGPAEYKGRDLVTAHKGMNIQPEEFVHATDDLMIALDKNNIDEATKKDVLFILWGLKSSVIGK
ncbi:MAG: group 1 truncated hemoglobin [Bacteroidota bacterium]